jgi:hypothetical protein
MLSGQGSHCLQHILLRIIALLSWRSGVAGTRRRGDTPGQQRGTHRHRFSLMNSLVLLMRVTGWFESLEYNRRDRLKVNFFEAAGRRDQRRTAVEKSGR